MLKNRVIPVLLLKNRGCVKTRCFKDPVYLGDPKNILRIFNDKEVDELIILDITASREKRKPDLDFIKELTVECFMPVCYGGGITDKETVKALFALGIEKVAINTFAFENPGFIKEISSEFGSQSIVVSIDVKKDWWGREKCMIRGGMQSASDSPKTFARQIADGGAGELFINSIDHDGLMQGYNIPLIQSITAATDIPVIACGGAGQLKDFYDVVHTGGAAAAAAGSFFVFQGIHRAVLISYPDYKELQKLFNQ